MMVAIVSLQSLLDYDPLTHILQETMPTLPSTNSLVVSEHATPGSCSFLFETQRSLGHSCFHALVKHFQAI